jgi:hypothetical protein
MTCSTTKNPRPIIGYSVPDGLNIYGLNSCTMDFKSAVMIGETSLTKNSKNDVRFSADDSPQHSKHHTHIRKSELTQQIINSFTSIQYLSAWPTT